MSTYSISTQQLACSNIWPMELGTKYDNKQMNLEFNSNFNRRNLNLKKRT